MKNKTCAIERAIMKRTTRKTYEQFKKEVDDNKEKFYGKLNKQEAMK